MYRVSAITCVVAVFCLARVANGWGDLVTYDNSGQSKCTEVKAGPTRDCRWHAGLYRHADQAILGGMVAAYKLQWFNGKWSGWFVPGVNDIDIKFNIDAETCGLPIKAKSMRRWWSYFYDHNHMYILCKNL